MKRIATTVVLAFGFSFAGLVGGAGLASAQTTADCYPGCTTPGHGSGLSHQKPSSGTPSTHSGHGSTPVAQPTSPAAATPAPAAGTLAFTGTDAVGTLAVGGLLIGGGLVVVSTTRRRRQVA